MEENSSICPISSRRATKAMIGIIQDGGKWLLNEKVETGLERDPDPAKNTTTKNLTRKDPKAKAPKAKARAKARARARAKEKEAYIISTQNCPKMTLALPVKKLGINVSHLSPPTELYGIHFLKKKQYQIVFNKKVF
jgi:hypothetical protein